MPSEEALKLATLILRVADVYIEVAGLDGDAMRGTDGAALVADGWDAALATILDNFTALRIGYLEELDFNLAGAIAAIPTVMVGTDGAALVADGWDAALATILDNFTGVLIGNLGELDFDLAGAIAAVPGTDGAALVADGWDAALATILDNFTGVLIGNLGQLDFDLQAKLIEIDGEVEGLAGAAMRGTEGAATVADGWDAALATILDNFTALKIGYLQELDFDLQTTLSTLQTDMSEGKLRAFRRTYAFVSTSESVAAAVETDLAPPAVVTVTFPAGATLLEAKVVAAIKANNQTAAKHNIGVTLQENIDGGGWNDLRDFTANPPLTLPEVDATADGLTLVEVITSPTTGQTVQFRWQVDSDNAGEVHYVQTFVLSVEYDFQ